MIKKVLRDWFDQLAGDEQAQETVKVAYLHLADFQELTDGERTATSAISQHSLADTSLPTGRSAQHLLPVMQAYEGVIERWNAERERLSEELRSAAKRTQRGASARGKGLGGRVTIVGYLLLTAGAALLFLGLISTWYYEGFSNVQEIMSPSNVVQYIMTLLILAPGFALVQLGKWLQQRASEGDNKH